MSKLYKDIQLVGYWVLFDFFNFVSLICCFFGVLFGIGCYCYFQLFYVYVFFFCLGCEVGREIKCCFFVCFFLFVRMFFMNVFLVVVFQFKWEVFGLLGSCRFFGCFLEVDEGVESVLVSVQVQMFISMLQCDGVVWGISDECVVQRGYRVEGCYDVRLVVKFIVYKELFMLVVCGFVVDFDFMGEEEIVDFGLLVLDLDSDDFVDWDIEEVIQEYLKVKSGVIQFGVGGVQVGIVQFFRVVGGGSRCKLELVYGSVLIVLCLLKFVF